LIGTYESLRPAFVSNCPHDRGIKNQMPSNQKIRRQIYGEVREFSV
jgi:hypothetical protein